MMGLGTDNVVKVKSDSNGRMCPKDLENQIKLTKAEGAVPIAVVATVGTTVFGSIDPVDQIADVCEENNVWLHIDGALAGNVFFTPSKKEASIGVERADSIT